MTTNDEIENTPEQLLSRAYALRGKDPEETLKLYADWAETYDQTMLDGLSYQSPQRIASLAAMTEARRDVRVLDVAVVPAYSQKACALRVSIGSTVWTTPPPCWQWPSAKAGSMKPFYAT